MLTIDDLAPGMRVAMWDTTDSRYFFTVNDVDPNPIEYGGSLRVRVWTSVADQNGDWVSWDPILYLVPDITFYAEPSSE